MHDDRKDHPPRLSIGPFLVCLYFVIVIPGVVLLSGVRLVMTPFFLEFEYSRSGFPEDQFGFDREQRLDYAKQTLDYLFNDSDIGFLRQLSFPDGYPLFTEEELGHMEDVKTVTRQAFELLLIFGCITTVAGVAVLLWYEKAKNALRRGLIAGSLLVIGLVFGIGILTVFAWDQFFTGFHEMFFESGTWRFAYSDTLIRLFPEQFWFDAAITTGGLAILGAGLILGITWRWKISALHDESTLQTTE